MGLNKNMKILVVDDFFIMCCIVWNLFVEFGFFGLLIQEVDDGENVMVMFKSQLFDMVVIDWNMFNMIGIDLLCVICVEVLLKGLLVLMVIVENNCDQIIVVVQVGVNGYIVKLFIVVMLQEKLIKIFEWFVVVGVFV